MMTDSTKYKYDVGDIIVTTRDDPGGNHFLIEGIYTPPHDTLARYKYRHLETNDTGESFCSEVDSMQHVYRLA